MKFGDQSLIINQSENEFSATMIEKAYLNDVSKDIHKKIDGFNDYLDDLYKNEKAEDAT